MVNKTLAIVSAAILVLAVAGFALNVPATVTKGAKNPTVVIPDHAVQVADHVFDLGTTIVNGREARGYAILDYKEGKGHKNGHGGGGKGGKPSGGSTCYAFMANGAKWRTVEDYIVDSTNSHGMTADFVNSAIDAGVSAWNTESPTTIFGNNVAGVVDGADTAATDGKNEIMFGDIAEPNVIAVTIVWGYFSGPPRWRELIEWDQVYDEVDFNWGDATVDPSVMDLPNIAAHEVGHGAGLDHPDNTCVDETMYAFGTEGEIKKRDLNAGDIAGVNDLY